MKQKHIPTDVNPCLTDTEKALVIAIATIRQQHPRRVHVSDRLADTELAAIQISSPKIGLVWHTGCVTIRELVEHIDDSRRVSKSRR
jgi:hypothetical protein